MLACAERSMNEVHKAPKISMSVYTPIQTIPQKHSVRINARSSITLATPLSPLIIVRSVKRLIQVPKYMFALLLGWWQERMFV